MTLNHKYSHITLCRIVRFTSRYITLMQALGALSLVLRADIGGLYDWNPTDEDMRGAKFSLLRLQTTYDLPVADLLSGIIVDRRTKPLSQQTAVETGFLALEMGQPDSTLEWLQKAANHTVGPLVDPSVIFHGLGKAHAMVSDQKISITISSYACPRYLPS